jgi:acetate kinase
MFFQIIFLSFLTLNSSSSVQKFQVYFLMKQEDQAYITAKVSEIKKSKSLTNKKRDFFFT